LKSGRAVVDSPIAFKAAAPATRKILAARRGAFDSCKTPALTPLHQYQSDFAFAECGSAPILVREQLPSMAAVAIASALDRRTTDAIEIQET
jgi:hypothetical protein